MTDDRHRKAIFISAAAALRIRRNQRHIYRPNRKDGKGMMEIAGNRVLESLYRWFQTNPWFVDLKVEDADMSQEVAAQQALLLFGRQ